MNGKERKDLRCTIDEEFGDYILQEGGNYSINLRKVGWGNMEPKIDIRRWTYNEGEERANKGIQLSEEATNELTNTLVEKGYGDTRRLIKAIMSREDYEKSLNSTDEPNNEDDDSDEEYYDPKEILS